MQTTTDQGSVQSCNYRSSAVISQIKLSMEESPCAFSKLATLMLGERVNHVWK